MSASVATAYRAYEKAQRVLRPWVLPIGAIALGVIGVLGWSIQSANAAARAALRPSPPPLPKVKVDEFNPGRLVR